MIFLWSTLLFSGVGLNLPNDLVLSGSRSSLDNVLIVSWSQLVSSQLQQQRKRLPPPNHLSRSMCANVAVLESKAVKHSWLMIYSLLCAWFYPEAQAVIISPTTATTTKSLRRQTSLVCLCLGHLPRGELTVGSVRLHSHWTSLVYLRSSFDAWCLHWMRRTTVSSSNQPIAGLGGGLFY